MKAIILGMFLITTIIHGQTSIPTDYFDNPLDIPLILAGDFGELRDNHFHSGLDIKTQQREGIAVYAPADGYVSRIKVAHFGYGKALYILHTNGYTTVYGHLQSYAGPIQEYVKQNQYKNETFEIELFPEANLLPVKKGQLIAYSGNTGGSGGPHLHYEIRDGSSRPMNPMLFGVEIPDTKKPLISSLIAYPIGEDAQIEQSQNPVKLRLILQQDGTYKTENIKAFGKIGFGISTTDQQNGASNKNGVYQIKTTYNGEENFDVLFDKFSFAETRYLNRFIDYTYYKENRERIQKLFRQSHNPLSIIKSDVANGYITVQDSLASNYAIEVLDFKGNVTNIVVPIEGKKQEILQPKTVQETEDYIYADQATSITKGKFSIYIPAESLYEDTYLNIEARSDTLKFHEDNIPIHENIIITADASNYTTADREKLYLGRLNYRGQPYYNTTNIKGDKLSARIRTFGTYVLVSDTTPPKIKSVNFGKGKWISNNKTLKVKIEDSSSGISSYRATINGKFILMEYNYKTDVLTYDFDDDANTETENNLKLIVVDNVGNSATFEATFFRK